MLRWIAFFSLVFGATAAWADRGLVAVLPLDVRFAQLDPPSRMALEEEIRTLTGDMLTPRGYTVLTGDTVLQLLRDNGVNPDEPCETSCALATAREMRASLFVSGSVASTEGEHLAFVRLFDAESGQQLSSVRLVGKAIRDLRRSFAQQARAFVDRARLDEQRAAVWRTSETIPSRPLAVVRPPILLTDAPTTVVKELSLEDSPWEVRRYKVPPPEPTYVPFVPAARPELRDVPADAWAVTERPAWDRRSEQPAQRKAEAMEDEVATVMKVEHDTGGTLSILGEPADARVVVSGPHGFRQEGRLPWAASGLRVGTYRIEVRQPGFAPHEQKIVVEPGRTSRAKIVLVDTGRGRREPPEPLYVTGDPLEVEPREGCVLLVNRGLNHQVRRGSRAEVMLLGNAVATGEVEEVSPSLSWVRVFTGECRFLPESRVRIARR